MVTIPLPITSTCPVLQRQSVGSLGYGIYLKEPGSPLYNQFLIELSFYSTTLCYRLVSTFFVVVVFPKKWFLVRLGFSG